MKKIAIIGTVGIPAKYGGFETLAENLADQLPLDIKIHIYCSSKSYDQKIHSYKGAKLIYLPLKANGLQSTPYDILAMLHAIRYVDTLLILGVSGCIALPFLKLFTKKRIIVNIDGLEWKREKWKGFARWFLKFSEKIAVRFSDVTIADNKVIQDYIYTNYGNYCELIPYGSDHVTKPPISKKAVIDFPFLQNNYAFSVCRIEPENNIHIILETMKNKPHLPLLVIGNWENSEYGKSLKKEYGNTPNLYLFEPIYEQDTLNQMRANCLIYIHGHSAGGTNPSLVEAMYLKLAIIAFDISYNRETTENKALYFADAEELSDHVSNLSQLPLTKFASDMKEIADRRYSWKVIAKSYAALF